MYTQENCPGCASLRPYGDEEEEIAADHEKCHGWFHCVNHCGPCIFCGQEGKEGEQILCQH